MLAEPLKEFVDNKLSDISEDIWRKTGLWYREKNLLADIPYMRNAMFASERIRKYLNCKGCGNCCNKPEGVKIGGVPVTPNEIQQIADRLNLGRKTIKKNTFVLSTGQRCITLPCPYRRDKCTIYTSRPLACRLYPFDAINNVMCVNVTCDPALDLYVQVMRETSVNYPDFILTKKGIS